MCGDVIVVVTSTVLEWSRCRHCCLRRGTGHGCRVVIVDAAAGGGAKWMGVAIEIDGGGSSEMAAGIETDCSGGGW